MKQKHHDFDVISGDRVEDTRGNVYLITSITESVGYELSRPYGGRVVNLICVSGPNAPNARDIKYRVLHEMSRNSKLWKCNT